MQTLSGGTVVPSTDKLPPVQSSVWSSWCTSARLLVWVWVRVKPACTSSSLHAFPFLQCALDSTPSPGPNPLISMPGEHRVAWLSWWKTGAWGDAWLQPLFLRLSQTYVMMRRRLSLFLTRGGGGIREPPPPICSSSILLPWPPLPQS